MLAITLGTHASGSTWLFNVARELYRAAGLAYFSATSDDANDALDQMPLNPGNIILKAHSLDQRLLRIAVLSKAKVLVSMRDPRDSVVSQRERFNSSLRSAASELSRSLASITSLPPSINAKFFCYENRFMDDMSTIYAVADFLEVPVSPSTVTAIHSDLNADAVRSRIEQRLRLLARPEDHSHDPETQWHPNHIGDGVCGKWRHRLDDRSRHVVEGCLNPLYYHDVWQNEPLNWRTELFENGNGLFCSPEEVLVPDGVQSLLVWGPYLHLPCGRWRAVPCLKGDNPGHAIRLEAEVFLPWCNDAISRGSGSVGLTASSGLTMEFDHFDHFQPVELRIWSLPGSSGTVSFSGWQLYWLGNR